MSDIKKITFGDTPSYLCSDRKLKKKVLEYIFSEINLEQYRYTMVQDMNKLIYLKNHEHYCIPHYKGNNYFLVFKEIDDKRYCIAIDRKKLRYKLEEINLNDVFMVMLRPRCSSLLFEGTILDGKLTRNKNNLFVINDCFCLAGKSYLNLQMEKKYKILDSLLEEKLKNSYDERAFKNFDIKFNKLYTYETLSRLINVDIKKSSYPINGITFIPKLSGINIIYIENKDNTVSVSGDNLISSLDEFIVNLKDSLMKREYSYEKSNKTQTFYIERNTMPDVYKLYDIKTEEYIDVACIPNMKTSIKMKELFTKINMNRIKIRCIKIKEFNKWMPQPVVE